MNKQQIRIIKYSEYRSKIKPRFWTINSRNYTINEFIKDSKLPYIYV